MTAARALRGRYGRCWLKSGTTSSTLIRSYRCCRRSGTTRSFKVGGGERGVDGLVGGLICERNRACLLSLALSCLFDSGQASLSRDALASRLIAAARSSEAPQGIDDTTSTVPPPLSIVLVLVTIHRRMCINALLRETEFPGIVVDTRGYLRKEREEGLKCTIKMA